MLAVVTLVSCDAPPTSMSDDTGEPITTVTTTKYEPINIPKTNYTTPFMSQMSTVEIPPQPTTATSLTPYQKNVSTYEHGNAGSYNLKTSKTTKRKLYNPNGNAISLKDIYSALLASDYVKNYDNNKTQRCSISLSGSQFNISSIKYTYRKNPYDPTAASMLTPETNIRFSITYNTSGSLVCNIDKQQLKTASDISFVNNIVTTLFNEVYKLYKYSNKKSFSSDWFKTNKAYSVKENGFTFTTDNSKSGLYINSFEINLISGLYF